MSAEVVCLTHHEVTSVKSETNEGNLFLVNWVFFQICICKMEPVSKVLFKNIIHHKLLTASLCLKPKCHRAVTVPDTSEHSNMIQRKQQCMSCMCAAFPHLVDHSSSFLDLSFLAALCFSSSLSFSLLASSAQGRNTDKK